MKHKEFERIAHSLKLEHSASYAIKGPIIALVPCRHVLRGVYFESASSDPDEFYVWVFSMLLCVPSGHVNFSMGERLDFGGRERWSRKNPAYLEQLANAITKEGFPFLAKRNTLAKVRHEAKRQRGTPPDPYYQEIVAFSLAREGSVESAIRELNVLSNLLNSDIQWEREMAERAQVLTMDLLADQELTRRRLDLWESETIRNLGIEQVAKVRKTK